MNDCSCAGRRCSHGPTYATAAIRFRIAGSVRFLSHAETLRVLQRACCRSGIPVRYTEGFNPHPRLSLPLPRSVGVESEDELLVARVHDEPEPGTADGLAEREAGMRRALAANVPEGMDVFAAELVASNAAFHPVWAEYVLPFRLQKEEDLPGRLREAAAAVTNCEHVMVERTAPGRRPVRRIDVRPFLRAVELGEAELTVQCLTGADGSIRIDEIMEIFGLGIGDLAGPVRRVRVAWETKQGEQTSNTPDDGEEDLDDGT